MTEDSNLSVNQGPIPLDRGQSVLALAGLGFVYGAVIVFGLVCYRLFNSSPSPKIESYIGEIMMCLIGAFAAILGIRLLRSVGWAKNQQPSRVINEQEWNAICDKVSGGDENAVTQYIRLTSLTGFTGMFTKLGLTGLPLATIALTLFFSLLALWQAQTFLDLAKLTLGAFIGSFVQKQVGAVNSGSVKLPTGETVPVSTPNESFLA